jgi:hypothetical protein
MGNDDAQRQVGKSREEQRDLVDVLDHYVGLFRPERTPDCSPSMKCKTVALARALYIDTIQHGTRSTTPPARGDQPDPVPSCCKTTKDLEQMDLGASRVGIVPILPVHQQDVHKRPSE